jgi:ribonuclease HII
MLLAGIEEAGRGPVIGPMVMVGVLVNDKDTEKLRSIGAKDSKLLTRDTREILYEQIINMVKAYEVKILTNKDIDNALNDPDNNLNKLEGQTSAELIDKLQPDKAIVDCPSTNIAAYAKYIKSLLTKDIEIIAEHKADVNYPVVSAASIIAKVLRDKEIDKLKKKYNVDFGSGYPADERTRNFLKENYNKYPFFRTTWSTYKKVVEDRKQSSLGDF